MSVTYNSRGELEDWLRVRVCVEMPQDVRKEAPALADNLARACNSIFPILCVTEAMFEDYKERGGTAYEELRDAISEVVHDVLEGTDWADDERIGVSWCVKGYNDYVPNPV